MKSTMFIALAGAQLLLATPTFAITC